jgi:CII-binding regulator of phage lambda lysogenization HflD
MNPKMLKVMRTKKKRAVDPDAPPRPNLMTHNVKLRDQDNAIMALTSEIQRLKEQMESLQVKLNNQTSYLQAVHSQLIKNK